MSAKPANPVVLQKGKLIDVQSGFVDTFNWLVSWVSNLKGEAKTAYGTDDEGIYVDNSISDHPVLKLKGAGMKLKSGDNSNVVISDEPDTDGYYKIDVYYL